MWNAVRFYPGLTFVDTAAGTAEQMTKRKSRGVEAGGEKCKAPAVSPGACLLPATLWKIGRGDGKFKPRGQPKRIGGSESPGDIGPGNIEFYAFNGYI